MGRNPQEPWRPPEPPNRSPRPPSGPRGPIGGGNPRARWMPWIVFGVLAITLFIVFSNGIPGGSSGRVSLDYGSGLLPAVRADEIKSIKYDASNGHISGAFNDKGKRAHGGAT